MTETVGENSITVLTVTYKRPAYLRAALRSFLTSALVHDIVVVDNNDDDNREYNNITTIDATAEICEASPNTTIIRLPNANIHYIKSQKNTGGAGGFALATVYSFQNISNKYLFIIDDDAELVDGCLEALVVVVERTRAPFVAPVVFNVLSESLELGQHKKSINLQTLKEQIVGVDELTESEIPIVANGFVGVLCRTELVKAIGGIYDRYFILYDDGDTTFRLSKKFDTGYLVTQARVLHKYAANQPAPYWKRVAEARSRLIFLGRNGQLGARTRALLSGAAYCYRHAANFNLFSSALTDLLLAFVKSERDFDPGRYRIS